MEQRQAGRDAETGYGWRRPWQAPPGDRSPGGSRAQSPKRARESAPGSAKARPPTGLSRLAGSNAALVLPGLRRNLRGAVRWTLGWKAIAMPGDACGGVPCSSQVGWKIGEPGSEAVEGWLGGRPARVAEACGHAAIADDDRACDV